MFAGVKNFAAVGQGWSNLSKQSVSKSHSKKFAYYVTYVKRENPDVLTLPTSRPSKTFDTSHLFGEFKKPNVVSRVTSHPWTH